MSSLGSQEISLEVLIQESVVDGRVNCGKGISLETSIPRGVVSFSAVSLSSRTSWCT